MSEAPAQAQITIQDPGASDAGLLRIAGELDISNVASLEAAVTATLARRPARLILDVAELSFMDSSALAVLVGAAAAVGQIHIRNPQPAVRRVIEVTGLGAVLPCEP